MMTNNGHYTIAINSTTIVREIYSREFLDQMFSNSICGFFLQSTIDTYCIKLSNFFAP